MSKRGRRAAALRPLRPQPSAQTSGRRVGRALSQLLFPSLLRKVLAVGGQCERKGR